MITIGPSQSIAAGATTTTTVNFTIMGLLMNTTAPPVNQAYTVLNQGQLTGSVAAMFSTSGSQTAIISAIEFFNTSTTTTQLVTVAMDGTAGTNTVAVLPIPASGFATYEGGGSWRIYTAFGVSFKVSTPQIGMQMAYGPNFVQPTRGFWNIQNFGGDPTITNDSTLAIYNAVVSCGLSINGAQAIVASNTTSTSATIVIGANALAASGTVIAMTTRGLVTITYTGGGGTASLTGCSVTAGVSGGTILAGSIIGVKSGVQVGGTVYTPTGFYITNHDVTNSIPGICFLGDGGTDTTDSGGLFVTGGSWWFYNGTQTDGMNSAVLRFVPITNASTGQALDGISVKNMNFDCGGGTTGDGACAFGVDMISCHGWHMENVYVNNPQVSAYNWNTLFPSMLGEAEDCTRGTMINCHWRCLDQPGTATNVSNSVMTQTALATNINALSNTTLTLSAGNPVTGSPCWSASGGFCQIQALDSSVGTVRWFLATYTGVSATTIVGVTILGLWWNQAGTTTQNAATPTSGNNLPSATFFSGSQIKPGWGAFANALRFHGSTAANSCLNTFIGINGVYYAGDCIDMGNCDSNTFLNPVLNRFTGAGNIGIGVVFHGATQAAGTARNNQFYGGSAGLGGVLVRGTELFSYTNVATDNYWSNMQVANGEPVPTIGSGGVNFPFSINGTVNAGPQFGQMTGDRVMSGRSTAAQTVNSTVATNVTGLNFPILQPGGVYRFEAEVYASNSTTSATGIGIAVVVPAGASLVYDVVGSSSAAALKTINYITTNTIQTGFITTSAFTGFIRLVGMVTAGTATSQTGTVGVQVNAVGTASTLAATGVVQLGTHLVATKL